MSTLCVARPRQLEFSASCASKRSAKTTGWMWPWQSVSFGEQLNGYLSRRGLVSQSANSLSLKKIRYFE